MVKKLTVQSNNLFKGYKIGGLYHGEYISLTAAEKLAAQLNYIEEVVTKISRIKYDIKLGWPSNLWHLALQVNDRIKRIELNADPANACMLTLEIGELIERINSLPLTKQAILNFDQMVTQQDSLEKTKKERQVGAAIANEIVAEKTKEKKELVIKKWHELEDQETDERHRVSNITNHLKDENGQEVKISTNTVKSYLKEAGLTPKKTSN
nr:hypothetical protein [uncultured Glaciecola sp.]